MLNLPELRKDLEDIVNRMTFRQLLFVGAVLSLVVALASYLYLSGLERQQVQQEQRLVNVVVAVGDIPAHSVIRQEQLKLIQLPREIVSAEAIMELQAAVGKTTRSDIFSGDMLTEKRLLLDDKAAGLVGCIPPDKRAISIAITDTTGVCGFARPGDCVDVMLISDKIYKNAVSGELVLQNVQLLGLNKKSETGKSESAEALANATLAVTPEEALRLAAAQSKGMIYLTLRPLQPRDKFLLIPEVLTSFAGGAAAESKPAALPPPAPPVCTPAAEPPAAPPEPAGYSLEVVRGSESSQIIIR